MRCSGRLTTLVLAVALIAVLPASLARAEHTPGVVYTGTHSEGGTVQFAVSDDGTAVTSFAFTDLPAGCGGGSYTAALSQRLPIDPRTDTFATITPPFRYGGKFAPPAEQTSPATLSARGTLMPTTTNPCGGYLLVTWTATAPRVADLSVDVREVDPVLLGDELSYILEITNAGPTSVLDATLTETLPAGATLVSAVAEQGGCTPAGDVVTCSLGRIATNGDVTASVIVKPSAAGDFTLRASVGSTPRDPDPATNSTTETGTVETPCIVPNVKGSALPAARRAIARALCGVGKIARVFSRSVAKGRVLSQKPAPGTRDFPSTKVSLVVSRGRRSRP